MPARLASQILPPRLNQPIVIENRPGAGGAIGAKAVASAAPDGYTLMAGNTSVFAVIPAVSASAGYDPIKDFAPVAKVSESFQILVVRPSFPANTLREFIDYQRQSGQANYAHTGLGGLPHLTAKLFKSRTGVDVVGLSYRSGEVGTALLSDAVHFTFEHHHPVAAHSRRQAARSGDEPHALPLAPDLRRLPSLACPTTKC